MVFALKEGFAVRKPGVGDGGERGVVRVSSQYPGGIDQDYTEHDGGGVRVLEEVEEGGGQE